MRRTIATIAALLFLSGCATNRAKALWTGVLLGSVGATVGALTAPQNENPTGHAVLWGGAGAAAGLAAGMFLFDEQKRSDELTRQNDVLKKSLSGLSGGDATSGEKVLFESDNSFEKAVPKEYRHLVRPGQWSVYQLDTWTLQGENTLVHQDKMIRLLPPELNLQTLTNPENPERKNDEQ